MNFNLLNKKWTSYFNWFLLYPSYFLLFITTLLVLLFSFVFSDLEHNLEILFSVFFIFIGGSFAFLSLLIFIYLICFLIFSDRLFKILGFNRLLANLINIILTFSGLGVITFIYLWIKIKDIYQENNIKCKFSGKF